MEKRLFLAIGLSLLVVFFFQSLWGPKPAVLNDSTYILSSSESLTSTVETPKKVFKSPDFLEHTEVFSFGAISLEITNLGGNVKSIFIPDLSYTFPLDKIGSIPAFDHLPFEIKRSTPTSVVLSTRTGDWSVSKTFEMSKQNMLFISLDIKNIASSRASLSDFITIYNINTSSLDINSIGADRSLFEYALATPKKVIRRDNASAFNEKWAVVAEVDTLQWLGFRDRYFALVAKPNHPLTSYSVRYISKNELAVGHTLSLLNLESGASYEAGFTYYLGPQDPHLLKSAGNGFDRIMVFSNWGWLDVIFKGIYWSLNALHKVVPVWGICIILVSLIIYVLMYPLTFKSLISMRKMQAIQPKIKQIQEKYKNNPEKLNQEIAAAYRQSGVNPLSGCLPMLLQMPIFVGLYQVLWRSYYFRGEQFLWIGDLSQPDRLFKLPFTLPFLGNYFNILPILMIGIMAYQQKMSLANISTDPEQAQQQKMMAILFPILIGVIFYNFSSGLNIYFVVFYLLSAVSQWKVSKIQVN